MLRHYTAEKINDYKSVQQNMFSSTNVGEGNDEGTFH